ncbi:MAG: LysR family transcriptional regulator [Anaerovoracaceae bacterium]|jgi:DNA-binding transcriptional LysR family regulator
MDIIKYKVFLYTVDRGSFNRVCEELGYSQSGISKMMSSMEKEIGFPLIKRNYKGVSLTNEGERVLPLIRQLVQDQDRLDEEFSLIRGVETGMLRIGTFPTIGFIWTPSIIRAFHEEHPNVTVETVEENTLTQLEQWLDEGIIDVGIFSRQPHQNYEWVGLKKDPYVALLPKGHPLAELDVVPVEKLFQEDFALFTSQEGPDQDVAELLEYAKVKPELRYTSNSDFTVIRMVEKNRLVTVIPKLIADYAEMTFDVESRPIDVDLSREIGIAVRNMKEASPALRGFVRSAKHVLEDM